MFSYQLPQSIGQNPNWPTSPEYQANEKRSAMALFRPSVPAMDRILGLPFDLLNVGHVRVIDYMGDDAAVVQAARTSYGKGTTTVNEDRGLIRYLMRHWHTTPSEMCSLKLHIKLPIFVMRQLIRHRTMKVNELSGRYSILPNEFYSPEPGKVAVQSKNNKQGRGEALEAEAAQAFIDYSSQSASILYEQYLTNTDDEGIAKELARMNLPVSIYTEAYIKLDAHNLMHLLRLRADAHAQYEIRVYADAILEILRLWMPMTYEAFVDYKLEALSLSRMAKNAILTMFRAFQISPYEFSEQLALEGMKKREIQEVLKQMGMSLDETSIDTIVSGAANPAA